MTPLPLDAAVRWTMLLSTAAWAVAEVLVLRGGSHQRAARAWWTCGITLALVHVALAFHVVYSWDHDAAVVDTARQTAELTGVAWRGGLFVNYAFLMIWLADASWWWIDAVSRASRPRAIESLRLALFVFMFANGAILFASGIGRIVGTLSVGAVVVAWIAARRRTIAM